MKRRTEILIEIEREIVITRRGHGLSWCIGCGKQVQMLTASEAAQVIQTNESVICELTDSGVLHFAATTSGMLLICPDSLVALQRDENAPPSPRPLITDGEVLAD